MSIEEWWAAERKAAEFWRKIKENQLSGRKSPHHGSGAAPSARPRVARLLSRVGLGRR